MANKWVNQLLKLEGAVKDRSNPWDKVIRTASPSLNQLFGHTHGLPQGFSLMLWGVAKSGKTVVSYSFAGQCHQDDPEAIVIKFDTEFRDQGQLTPDMAAAYGIDLERWVVFQVNDPAEVFDQIQMKIGPMVAAGAPIKLIIVDSTTGIQGVGESKKGDSDGEAKSGGKAKPGGIKKYHIGDHARTIGIGLKQILPIQRAPGRSPISLILVTHAAAEMDMQEQMKGRKLKAAAAHGLLHHCEFFMNVSRNDTKAGRKDALDRTFEDASRVDVKGNAEQTAHKIFVWMQDSTMGPKGRRAEFTFDDRRGGIINQHEELFDLGNRWNVIPKDKNFYLIGDQRFNGIKQAVQGLEKSKPLQDWILGKLLEAESRPPQGVENLDPEDAYAAAAAAEAEGGE